jgi:pSer/pThr/pTyr-binding forkhead associated (FHA) protein
MSTDSTELTFVRCPSCRSLVPGISTRCRMCGATLEAAPPSDETDQEPKKSGRVRQRTMSDSNGEVETALEQARNTTTPATNLAPASSDAPFAEPVEEDPLSAYMEDLDSLEDEDVPTETEGIKAQSPDLSGSAPAFGDDGDEDEALGIEKEPSDLSSEDTDLDDPLAAYTQPVVAEEPVKPTPKEESASPRVVIESGQRKPGSQNNLSFGGRKDSNDPTAVRLEGVRETEKPKAQPPRGFSARTEVPEQKAKPDNRPQQQPQQHAKPQHGGQGNNNAQGNQSRQGQQPNQQRQPANQPPANRPQGSNQDRRAQQPPRDESRQQPPKPNPKPESQSRPQVEAKEVRQQSETKEERQQPQQSQQKHVHSSPSKAAIREEGKAGRLFGWLVNYADPNGSAIEIREGKFFVSGKSVKPSDMVIDDRTISSPHALLTVGPATGVLVQDLMSERGVHVRRKGMDTYKREEESVAVTHGDWLRFGDVEFLISLIAHPGEE